ncbi:hybrid sensor histidine kinase/response regulator [Mangrovibacterium marinum]|uniref:histidine kinase n=1 Tax=Mangrovibacterium marinum TaxID=1639118 RepID=A0A2T5C6I6_9BACT|nr:hybrid sensor histidine kinase/response regulator [Mangrovibacterium marinum]PTN10546.1 two-component system, unclassified family, sensor histidine kinase and response regulator [Mangrovibacterium marinum]
MATLLIVDDNKNNLQVLGSILGENGYKVAMSINGMNVPKLIEKVSPDLIILDIMMPVMDGFEVCKNVKEIPEYKDIPIIFLTAKSDIESITEGFRIGGVDYITKPFRKEELLARVKTHIDLVNSRKLIQQQARELEALNQLKNKVFTAVSNDLYGSINVFSEMHALMNNPRICLEKEDLAELFTELKKKSDTAAGLLENLLWWSKSQRRLLHPKPSQFNLQNLLSTIVQSFSEKSTQKKINLKIEGNTEAMVVGDQTQLEIVFKNLIDNAIKFSNKNSSVVITLKPEGNTLICEIADSGTGMDEEALAKVLDKYEFFSEYGTDNEKGTGIGLLLCDELLGANNAKMTVTSQKDKGTRVRVILPTDL